MSTWQPKQFPEYFADYSLRLKHKTSYAPAVSTLRTKEGHLSTVARLAGISTDDEHAATLAFAELLSDRSRVVQVLDAVNARMTSGGARYVVFTLLDYAEYVGRTLADGDWTYALTKQDVPPANPMKPVRTFTPDEVEVLVSAARGISLRWFAFVATLADSGRRPGEVLNLEWSWSRLDATPPHFVLPTTKTHRPQAVVLTERLMRDVFTPRNCERLRGEQSKRYARSPELYVFPFTYTTANARWVRFTQTLGLSHRGGLHKFRHSKATQLLAAGVPIHTVARLLGHASVATTMRTYDGTSALTFADVLSEHSTGR